MTLKEVAEKLLRAHYYLMSNKRFWYDKGILEASKILCVTASNIKAELRGQRDSNAR